MPFDGVVQQLPVLDRFDIVVLDAGKDLGEHPQLFQRQGFLPGLCGFVGRDDDGKQQAW
jgi:hypothetical protein